MLKIKSYIKQHQKMLKTSYITIITLFILYAIYIALHQISWQQIVTTCNKLNLTKITIMLVLGCISIIPMAIYDIIYNQRIHSHESIIKLLSKSFIINTFANVCGGGGLIGGNLRAYLFGHLKNKTLCTTNIITQIALFTLVGLLVNTICALILSPYVLFKMPWIIKLCGLIFVAFMVVALPIAIKNHVFSNDEYLALLIGSTIEWIFALGFFIFVGFLLGLHFHFLTVYLITCLSGIAGVLSFIPGGLGSFDTVIVIGLSKVNIHPGITLAWVILYRLGYYIVPFLLSLIGLGLLVIKRHI